eukprot:PhF_6_TR11187/c0_g1_i1/m.18028
MYEKLKTLVKAMTLHKENTLKILRHIQSHQNTYKQIKQLIRRYSEGQLTTLEVQTLALTLLYDWQKHLLRITEAVEVWRAGCTRPYAFLYEGENYFLTVLKMAREFECSALYKALPLPYCEYPLLSIVPSLELFKDGGGGGGAGGSNTSLSLSGALPTYPLKGNNATSVKSMSKETARLRRAESMLRSEPRRQINVLKELTELALKGSFVPILNVVKEMLPQGELGVGKGIRVQSVEWIEKLTFTLKATWDGVLKVQRDLNLGDDDEDQYDHGNNNNVNSEGGGGQTESEERREEPRIKTNT